jgi:hypothetical protein
MAIRLSRLGVVAPAVILSALMASATFGASLTDPPGVYMGNGQYNSNWTVTTGNAAFGTPELGLRAQLYGDPTPALSVGNQYFVATGVSPFEPAGKTRGDWNFDFSVNNFGAPVAGWTYNLTVTDTHGNVLTFDPSAVSDNAHPATGTGFQNSENIAFFPQFNYNVPDTYTITLTATNSNNFVQSDTIYVNSSADPAAAAAAVPVPAAAYGGFSLLGGLGIWRLRKGRKAKMA